ncbi:MAG: hypothetical protein AAF485_03260 [Chloroflexota bacterium]
METTESVINLHNESADQVKRAVEQVTTITTHDDHQITFEGKRIMEGHGYNLTVNCYDIYQCPNGFLLHVYMDDAPSWAVSNPTLIGVLRATPLQAVAQRAHGELVKKGLLSMKHHLY